MGNEIVKEKKTFFEKAVNLLAFVIFVLLLMSLVRNLSKMRQVKLEIEKGKYDIEIAEKEKEEVEEKLRKVKSEEYIEKQLRDNLGLSREGEIIVILPEDDIVRKFAPKEEKEEEFLPDPNWKKWAKLFGISF